jgi:hypothetical protein
MKNAVVALLLTSVASVSVLPAQPPTDSPYKVLKSAKVGGEGGTDYIYADADGRRLYIPRGGQRAMPATETSPAKDAVPGRISVFDIETLKLLGEIPNTGGHGVAVDPKSGHGFSSSEPVSMFDTKTMAEIKTIDVGKAQPDGIYYDSFDARVYIFSHPTKDATVIDAKDGKVLGTIDLGGVPEQAVSDGKGTLYVVMQDAVGGVAVVDTKTMKTTAHYSFVDKGGCNGLALDARNHILFAACARSGNPPAVPSQPMMVIMNAKTGAIITSLPLAGGSDGAVFNPATMEAFSSHGNGTMTVVKEKSPTSFVVEENLNTMNGARTITLDTKTGHLFVMSVERGVAPPAVAGGRPPQAPAIPGSFTIVMVGKP